MVERPEGDVPPRTPTESARLVLTLASLGVLGDDKPGKKGDGKDEKKEDKKDDPAALKKEAEKAAKDLVEAATKGDLGKAAKAAIELVFKRLREEHKDDPTKVLDGLRTLGRGLNGRLDDDKSPNQINIGAIPRKDGTTDYYIVLRKPGDKEEDIKTHIEKGAKDSPTVIRIGSLTTKPKE